MQTERYDLGSQKIPFRFVHDIAELLTVLEQNGISLPEHIRAAAELSDYAVEARYPGPMEPVTEDEYKEAVKIAEMVKSIAISARTSPFTMCFN